jgi:energy-coupling factor transporter ATP-binding protein EcfA2
MITFNHVTYHYPQAARPVLADLSLRIADGEFVLVVGASGAGKSTLLRCLNGLVPHFYGGEIVGSVRARMDGGTCRISRLVVRPDHWRQGIGRQLMEEIERLFDDAERFELYTREDHSVTRPFYRSLGYAPFRTERHSDALTFVYLFKAGRGNDGAGRPKG